MNEPTKNIYDRYDFSECSVQYANCHVISHSPREFFLTFGMHNPPNEKIHAVAQVILTEQHLVELILSLQSQLKQLKQRQGESQKEK